MYQKSIDELIHIAAAGGGFTIGIDSMTTDDLTRIAAAAAGTGTRITLSGAGARATTDLVRIATAGRGVVCFE